MFETTTRYLSVSLKPSELNLDVEEILLNKVKEYEHKHLREEKKVITRILSILSVENTQIDEDIGTCLCKVAVLCEQYSLVIGEKLTLDVKNSNKNGFYFEYGPFDIFVANQAILDPTLSGVPSFQGTSMSMSITSIRFSDINHKFIVLAQQTE